MATAVSPWAKDGVVDWIFGEEPQDELENQVI